MICPVVIHTGSPAARDTVLKTLARVVEMDHQSPLPLPNIARKHSPTNHFRPEEAFLSVVTRCRGKIALVCRVGRERTRLLAEAAQDGERHSPGEFCLLVACSGVSDAVLVGHDPAVECRIVELVL